MQVGPLDFKYIRTRLYMYIYLHILLSNFILIKILFSFCALFCNLYMPYVNDNYEEFVSIVQGNVIKKLGTSSHPWTVTASVRVGTGNPSAVLEGNTTLNVVDGWANFTNLLITHFGQNYILDFNISYPDEGENVSLSSDPFTIAGRPIKGSLVSRSTTVVEKALLSVVLELKDEVTLETISNITWRVREINLLCFRK